MRKLLYVLSLVLVGSFLAQFTFGAARLTGQAGMMSQGKIRTCLSPKLVGKPPAAWFKRAAVSVQLTGTCEAASCTILRCNSNNKEIEENKNFEKKCKAGKIGNANCGEKLDANQKKIEKSVEKKPGCKTIGYVQGGAQAMIGQKTNTRVLGATAGSELPNGPVNVLTNEGDYTAHVDYTYYAVGDNAPIVTGQATNNTAGANNSQQLAQLNFTSIESSVEGKSKDCTKISWDPYGRIFDALSLEPLEGIEITLIDNTTKLPVVQEFEESTTTTGEDGVYNILVEKSGMYQMVVKEPTAHSLTQLTTLHQNYINIYSDIYRPGKTFEEIQGVATHHDIPLQPKGAPYTGTIASIMTADESVDMGDYVLFTGKSNFPLARVCMVTETGRTLVGECVFADKFGEYSISVEKDSLPLEVLVPQASKVSLTELDWKNNVASPVASYDIRKYEPILNHIEGYAYDKHNKIIPYAHVQVHLQMDDSVFFEDDADKDGFIAIYSEDLPANEYYLTYNLIGGGSPMRKSTTEFVKDNDEYIKENKLNLILAQVNNTIIAKNKNEDKEDVITRKKVKLPSVESESNNPISSTQSAKKINQSIGIMIVLIVLALGIGVGITIMMKAKKTQNEF